MTRKGDWIQTYTGVQFWPLDPRPEDIRLEDIAHALSNQCRFSGHCSRFYSVAQHSVHVSQQVPDEFKRWALLHDASEAYMVDLPRPIKRASEMGSLYREIESRLMAVICDRFGLDPVMPECVHVADNVLLMTEKRDLMRNSPAGLIEDCRYALLPGILPLWMPRISKEMFLQHAGLLGLA